MGLDDYIVNDKFYEQGIKVHSQLCSDFRLIPRKKGRITELVCSKCGHVIFKWRGRKSR